MSLTPPFMPLKAIVRPSGDQVGLESAPTPSTSIFCSMSPDSVSTIASSLSPSAKTAKTNLEASGDQSPAESMKRRRLSEAIRSSVSGTVSGTPEPSALRSLISCRSPET